MTYDSSQVRRVRVVYKGRVQGVGFRWNVCEVAQQIGLTGWVKNEVDGSVICEIQGTTAQIAEFYTAVPERFAHYPVPVTFMIDDAEELVPLTEEKRFCIRH